MYSLTLYSTSPCKLCVEAEQVINEILAEPILAPLSIQIKKQDIKVNSELAKAYGTRIPVVALFENQQHLSELNWPFDRQRLVMWMVRAVKSNM